MRIGHGTKLVPVMLEGKVIGPLPGFDRQQVLRNGPAMDHNIGIYRFADIVVGRDDRSLRQQQPALADPIIVAIDVPSIELGFEMDRKAMRQGTLANIFLKQKRLARVEHIKRADNLIQFGSYPSQHVAPHGAT